jgi:hypothetical protein
LAGLKVLVMGAYFIEDIFADIFAADFRGNILQLAAKQIEPIQRGQEEFERSKPTKASPGKVERLERSEAGQRGNIAEPLAIRDVEHLERGEVGQRGEIAAEVLAPGEVERLERGEARQRGEIAELPAVREVDDWIEVRRSNSGGSRFNFSNPVKNFSVSFHPLRSNSAAPVFSACRKAQGYLIGFLRSHKWK